MHRCKQKRYLNLPYFISFALLDFTFFDGRNIFRRWQRRGRCDSRQQHSQELFRGTVNSSQGNKTLAARRLKRSREDTFTFFLASSLYYRINFLALPFLSREEEGYTSIGAILLLPIIFLATYRVCGSRGLIRPTQSTLTCPKRFSLELRSNVRFERFFREEGS